MCQIEFEDQEEANQILDKAMDAFRDLDILYKKLEAINDSTPDIHEYAFDYFDEASDLLNQTLISISKQMNDLSITIKHAKDYDPSDIEDVAGDETAMYKARAL